MKKQTAIKSFQIFLRYVCIFFQNNYYWAASSSKETRNCLCKQIDIMFSLANQCVTKRKRNNALTFMATIILLMLSIKELGTCCFGNIVWSKEALGLLVGLVSYILVCERKVCYNSTISWLSISDSPSNQNKCVWILCIQTLINAENQTSFCKTFHLENDILAANFQIRAFFKLRRLIT